jgi:hypothetical protein
MECRLSTEDMCDTFYLIIMADLNVVGSRLIPLS